MVEYHVGQKYHDSELSVEERDKINKWCIENGYQFRGLMSEGSLSKYILNPFSEEQLELFNTTLSKILKDMQWCKDNDFKHNKYLRGEYTEEEWNKVKEEFSIRSTNITTNRNILWNLYTSTTVIDEEYSN